MRIVRWSPLLVAVVALCASSGLAPDTAARAKNLIFELKDPRGDDHGDGSLVYPMREDYTRGDLDLLSLTARAEEGGTLFEATFARSVRKPERRPIDVGGGTLDKLARFGFYTFNIDVYIDIDRVPGSGSTNTLPGRVAEIAPENAWERAICLTPIPFQAQEELRRLMVQSVKDQAKLDKKKLRGEEVSRLHTEADADIASRVFFPTVIHVSGPRISFFVPDTFLGGPAKDTWSYVVAVSGADVVLKFDIPAEIMGGRNDALMILPIESGRPRDAFGGAHEDEEDYQPPLIDIVVPPGKTQEEVLRDYDTTADRPVRLPGVVPAEMKTK